MPHSGWKGQSAALGLWVAFPASACPGSRSGVGLERRVIRARGAPVRDFDFVVFGWSVPEVVRKGARGGSTRKVPGLHVSGSPPPGQSTAQKVGAGACSRGEAQPRAASHTCTRRRAHTHGSAYTHAHPHTHAHTDARTRTHTYTHAPVVFLHLPVGLLLVPRCFLSTCPAF